MGKSKNMYMEFEQDPKTNDEIFVGVSTEEMLREFYKANKHLPLDEIAGKFTAEYEVRIVKRNK